MPVASYDSDMILVQLEISNANLGHVLELLRRNRAAECRGFEWGYWWRLCHRELHVMRDHAAAVKALAWSRDGDWLASGGQDGSVRIWDAAGNAQTVIPAEGSVESLAVSADGQWLAFSHWVESSSSKLPPSYVTIVRMDGLQSKRASAGHSVHRLAFCDPRHWLAAGQNDGQTSVFDATTGDVLFALGSHGKGKVAVAYNHPMEKLVTAGADGKVAVWDMATQEPTATFAHEVPVIDLTSAHENGRIASVDVDGVVKVWDIAESSLIEQFVTGSPIKCLSITAAGDHIVTGDRRAVLRLWNVDLRTRAQRLGHLRSSLGGITDVAFDSSGKTFASAGVDGAVRSWITGKAPEFYQLKFPYPGIHAAQLTPDGERVVVGVSGMDFDNGLVSVWELESGRRLQEFEVHRGYVNVDVSPDGETVLTSYHRNQKFFLHELKTGRRIREFTARQGNLHAGFSHDGGSILSYGQRKTMLWSLEGELRAEFSYRQPVISAALSPDAQSVATALLVAVDVRDLGTNRLHELQADCRCVAFHPGGKSLASSSDNQIVLRDTLQRAETARLLGHYGGVSCLAFSGDGRRLISGAGDGTIRIWNASTAQQLVVLECGDRTVRMVSLSRDDQRLAAVLNDEVRVYQSDLAEPPTSID